MMNALMTIALLCVNDSPRGGHVIGQQGRGSLNDTHVVPVS